MNTKNKNRALIKMLVYTCMLFMVSAMSSSAQSWQDFFNKAIDNAQSGNMEGAITNFTEALAFKEMPDERKAQAYYFRGIANAQLDKVTDAIADLSETITLDPNYKEAYLQRGLLYNNGLSGVTPKEALADLNVAVKLLPDNRDAHWGRGIALGNNGKNEEAVKEFTKAIELMDGNDLESIELRGIEYRKLDKFEQAIKDFNELIRMQPKSSEAYLNRGVCYSLMKNHEYAIRDYTQAIVLNPGSAEAHFNRGLAYARIDNHQKAISDFSKVIQNVPVDTQENKQFVAEAYLNRAIELVVSGKSEDGCDDFRKSSNLGNRKAIDVRITFCGSE